MDYHVVIRMDTVSYLPNTNDSSLVLSTWMKLRKNQKRLILPDSSCVYAI